MIRVAVVEAEFWGGSLCKEKGEQQQGGREGSMAPYGHLESPRLQGWCGHGEQQQRHSRVPGGGKLHTKLGVRAVLGEPSYPPRSEVDTGMVNNHHHLRLGCS